jgi:hypothetical protein
MMSYEYDTTDLWWCVVQFTRKEKQMDFRLYLNLIGSAAVSALVSASAIVFVAGANWGDPAMWSAAGAAAAAGFFNHIRQSPVAKVG